jgi:hypothetical protein
MKFELQRREVIRGGAVLAAAASLPDWLPHAVAQPSTFVWERLNQGSGGYSTGLDIQADGLGGIVRVVKTDTAGAYVRAASATSWRQCFTTTSIPSSDLAAAYPSNRLAVGCWEIAIAPSNVSILYAMYAPVDVTYVYKSTDQGLNWTKTTFTADPNPDANGGLRRFSGQRLAIDPNNPDVVYAGNISTGLWQTIDGGLNPSSWTHIAAITTSTSSGGAGNPNSGHAGLVFDLTGQGGTYPTTTVVSGQTRTSVFYAPSYGRGVWQTVDGGQNWTQIADGGSLGGPTCIYHAQIGPGGAYYAAENGDRGNPIWKYLSRTWSQLIPPPGNAGGAYNSGCFAVDSDWTTYPQGRVVCFMQGSNNKAICTTDGGTTWIGPANQGYNFRSGYPTANPMVAPDCLWHEMAHGLDEGDAKFNPVTKRCEVATGFQYAIADLAAWKAYTGFNWNYFSEGMEQLIPNGGISPVGGNPVFACWDVALWYNLSTTTFPTDFGPVGKSYNELSRCWDLSYCYNMPTFIAAKVDGYGPSAWGAWTYISSSGGQNGTWTALAHDFPSNAGCIAVNSNDTTNFVGAPAFGTDTLYYTLDQGATAWNAVGGAAARVTGWGGGDPSFAARLLAADTVDADTFYAWNVSGSNSGCWISVDKGQTFSKKSGTVVVGGLYPRMRSVPGHSGHLFIASGLGFGSHPKSNYYLMKSIDHGAHWTIISGVAEPWDVSIGAPANPSDYPAVYIIGWVTSAHYTSKFGIWRSDDAGSTWNLLGDYDGPVGATPLGSPLNIFADINTFGKVYVGIGGSGFMQGSFK